MGGFTFGIGFIGFDFIVFSATASEGFWLRYGTRRGASREYKKGPPARRA
ncbi:hypothetical protein VCRA2119O147_1250011 [Vibrio crassostreae]|nr:hypothetical protein VCRA2110O135_80060 [Vibrio crassostreae]CAK2208792.1 hypothetical protein VCRA2113O138_70179 [Vibrio crassostreae]CAK2217374.1 hypothetical protein VCRA2113O140_80046 [Vibrio crassostreae]CAK2219240.1 hypothetical protein VCRA2113O137_80054 [Vibrio crassostreae]CAK2273186.1 hypothetical protein VCRA2119O145_90055 [Vibrio crassostreae]